MNMVINLRHLLIAIVALSLVVPKAFPEPTATRTTLCSVAKNPEQYNNRLITVTAQYESDGTEHEALIDSSCLGAGVELVISRSTKGRDDLQNALRDGYPGTLDKTVIGTFTGVFLWHPDARHSRVLNVREMQDFTVKMKALPTGPPAHK